MSDLNSYEEGLANDLAKAQARIEELEAKLAKHDALMQAGFAEYQRRLANAMQHVAEYSNDPHLVKWARATLAELKGETDE